MTKPEDSGTQTFDNGLSDNQENEIYDTMIEISRVKERVESMPRHRSLSLAVTKLDEAWLWLHDRVRRPEQV